MSNPVTHYWETHERIEIPMPTIIKKVPFKHQVITKRNEVWGYVLENKKPRYYFLYSYVTETVINPNPGTKYMTSTDVIAVKKSIHRHKRKLGEAPWFEKIAKLQVEIDIAHMKLRNAVKELKNLNNG